MFRKSFALAFLASALPLAAESEILRALPVDPSEITPQEKTDPLAPAEPAAPVAEVTPLPPGTVKMPEQKPSVKTDAPDIANLPSGGAPYPILVFAFGGVTPAEARAAMRRKRTDRAPSTDLL